MVIGSRTALEELGQQLIACSVERNTDGTWPPQIANPTVVSPYNDIPNFTLSFHLQGSNPPQTVLPLTRRNPPFALFLTVIACAAVGMVTIFRWGLALAL